MCAHRHSDAGPGAQGPSELPRAGRAAPAAARARAYLAANCAHCHFAGAPGTPAEIGRMAEDLGFDSLFFPEHTHIPLSVRSLIPDDPAWLEACKRMVDPFVALAGTFSRPA